MCYFIHHLLRVARRDSPSGFGFELTFRLKKQAGETSPPSWPAELLQSLARYVFQTGVCAITILPLEIMLNTNLERVHSLGLFPAGGT